MRPSTREHVRPGRLGGWSLVAAVLTALGASACCVGPLVLLVLGVSGAWASRLSALEPYRPMFTALTLGLWGYAFYRTYQRANTECCAARGRLRSKVALWLATAFILCLIAFPYLAPRLFAQGPGKELATVADRQVVLKVGNLTCASCAAAVQKALAGLSGVKQVTVSTTPPEARVIFDPALVSIDTLRQTTARAGYPSSPEQARTKH